MAITVTEIFKSQGDRGNIREVHYSVVLAAEPYVAGGIQLDTTNHLKDAEAPNTKHFESIDTYRCENPYNADADAHHVVDGISNSGVDTPLLKLKLHKRSDGAQVAPATAITSTFRLIVVGVPPNAPGGALR